MEKLNFAPTAENPNDNPVVSETEKSDEGIFLGKTRDGKNVYNRKDNSHLHKKGGLKPEILSSAIGVISTDDKLFVEKQVDFDGLVGYQSCVEVGPEDDVVMVYRNNRPGQTPMVKHREALPSNSVTIIMKKEKKDKDDYIVLTSYVGTKSEREPWDTSLRKEEDRSKAKEFWSKHALIYDESEIDKERTDAFNTMTEDEKQMELMSDKVFYEGLFINSDDLQKKIAPTLKRKIRDLHVTTKFDPKGKDLNLGQLGTKARIRAVGYGNDGKNEGLLVEVEADDPVIQEACDALEVPHITLSLGPDGKPQDTAKLDFKPLAESFEIGGEYGLYSQGRIIKDSLSANELRD